MLKQSIVTSLSAVSFLILSSTVSSQDQAVQKDKTSIVNKVHLMHPAVKSCLANLTQNCSLTAAIKTVNDESQAMERAKVLLGVAESMISLGQKKRANFVLDLAEEAARSTQLSIAIQVALKDIVPLQARLGNYDKAIQLASEVKIKSVRDNLLSLAVQLKAKTGMAYTELAAFSGKISKPNKAFWIMLKIMQEENITLAQPDIDSLRKQVQAITGSISNYRARASFAAILWKNGNKEEAQVIFDALDAEFVTFTNASVRARLAASKLSAMHYAGFDDQVLTVMLDFTKKQALSINSPDEQASFAEKVGPVEVRLGKVDAAVNKSNSFEQMMDQIEYIEKLATLHGKASSSLSRKIRFLSGALVDVEDAYERDVYRYRLLRAALAIQNKVLMIDLMKAMEDDDNQARGLALMAPLLQRN